MSIFLTKTLITPSIKDLLNWWCFQSEFTRSNVLTSMIQSKTLLHCRWTKFVNTTSCNTISKKAIFLQRISDWKINPTYIWHGTCSCVTAYHLSFIKYPTRMQLPPFGKTFTHSRLSRTIDDTRHIYHLYSKALYYLLTDMSQSPLGDPRWSEEENKPSVGDVRKGGYSNVKTTS